MDVPDRRLIISNTNLAQLEGGLARVIANHVDTVSRAALRAQERKQDAAQLDLDERTERAAEVMRAATRVRFIPDPANTTDAVQVITNRGNTSLTATATHRGIARPPQYVHRN
jgi:hypothetical protein